MKRPMIAVVDRDPVHRNLINYNLVVNRFSGVQAFPSGEECLYRIRKSLSPDYIITDTGPDEQEGMAFLARVKAVAPAARVIFFSSFPDEETAQRLHDAGAADYVPKTAKPDLGIPELIKNLRYLIREAAVI